MLTSITWDGHVLASPVSGSGSSDQHGETVELYIHRIHQRYTMFPDSKWGLIEAIAIAAPMTNYAQWQGFLQERPLEEVIEFYQRASRYGLLGKKLQMMFMAITPTAVITLVVNARQCGVTCTAREIPMAIGHEAMAAAVLMRLGAPADIACGIRVMQADRNDGPLRINSVTDVPDLNVKHIPSRTPEPWHQRITSYCTRDDVDAFLQAAKVKST